MSLATEVSYAKNAGLATSAAISKGKRKKQDLKAGSIGKKSRSVSLLTGTEWGKKRRRVKRNDAADAFCGRRI